jgi:hypothetical protein
VDAIFVQKISNFWRTCGLVLVSRRTNFYKIPIFGDTIMPQKTHFRTTFGQPIFKFILNFFGLEFFS